MSEQQSLTVVSVDSQNKVFCSQPNCAGRCGSQPPTLTTTGLTDDEMQSKLGLATGVPSVNITNKLIADCF